MLRSISSVFILAFLSFCTFSRCEEPVDLGVVIPESELIVISIMYPDEPVTVRVTSTNNSISGNESTPVENAIVEIFANGNVPVATLTNVAESNGLYVDENFYPVAGASYQVRVLADGYGLAFANSYVPPASELTEVTTTNLVEVVNGDEVTYSFDLGIEFEDPEALNDYYNLRLLQEIKHYVLVSEDDTLITGSTYERISFSRAANNEYKIANNLGGILFIDNPFNGEMSFPISSTINSTTELIGQVYTELRTVSEEYYLFEESIISNPISISGGLTNPNDIYSNVENGEGTVSGYSSQTVGTVIGGN